MPQMSAKSLLPALDRLFMMNKPLTQDDNHDDVCLLIVQPHHLGFPPGRTGTDVPRLSPDKNNGGARPPLTAVVFAPVLAATLAGLCLTHGLRSPFDGISSIANLAFWVVGGMAVGLLVRWP